uniref:Choline transporter-like protein n=1 Tax=Spongospora subterranea TaxID=70186 RepID=A0A0H5R479_9EUKA|eukprot:CRZ09010.1 hypothetical protein [Spongospora subterranea]
MLSEQQYQNKPSDQQDVPAGKYNDVIWALLFVLNVVAVCVAAGFNFKKIDINSSNTTATESSGPIIAALACGFIASIAFGIAWIRVLNHPAISINVIKFAMFANIGLSVIACAIAFAAGQVVTGVIMLIFSALAALWYYVVRNRIAFTTIMLEMATACTKQYTSTVFIAIVVQFVALGWIVLWVIAILGASGSKSSVVIFLLVLSLYWTLNVLMNVVQVTVGGVAATWYYQSQSTNVVSSSAKRACTTSFGSICFGSFIVSAIEALRAVARASGRDNQILACIVDCILSIIQAIAEFISKYAYAYVAIWGQDFCTSAKNTWGLLKRRGFDVIVNDDLSNLAFWMSSLIGGVVGAAVGALVFLAAGGKTSSDGLTASMLLCFFLGAFLTGVVMSVIESCVVTFMVLWAEEPAPLAQNHQALHQKLIAAVRKMYPSIQGPI